VEQRVDAADMTVAGGAGQWGVLTGMQQRQRWVLVKEAKGFGRFSTISRKYHWHYV